MLLQPHNIALFFTVVLLAVTAYFLLGSVPLLVLKHDNPIDSHFIRSFYLTYYRIAWVVALATAASQAWAGRHVFALGAAGIALLTLWLRSRFIPRMDALSRQMGTQDMVTIPAFRSLHKTAILINTTQLGVILGSLGSF